MEEGDTHFFQLTKLLVVGVGVHGQIFDIVDGATAHLQALVGNSVAGKLVDENGLPTGGAYVRKLVKRKGFTVEPMEYIDFRFKKTFKGKEVSYVRAYLMAL